MIPDVESRPLTPAEAGRGALSQPARIPMEFAPRRGTGLLAAMRRRMASATRYMLLVGVFYTVFFNLSVVRGNSMAPGIHDGDRILVEPWTALFGGIEREDIVVLRYPLDPSVDYIKRVIGLPGDLVTLAGGHVWVNGELLEEPYIAETDQDSYLSTRVRDGHYFVLGDNRPRSSDSREFGQVPMDYVRGRVDVRLWPLSRLGWID